MIDDDSTDSFESSIGGVEKSNVKLCRHQSDSKETRGV